MLDGLCRIAVRWGAVALITCASCASDVVEAQLASGAPADGFELEAWVDGVSGVTDVAFVSDGRAVITRKGGTIAVAMPDGTMQNATAGTIEVDTGSEKGLLGVVRGDDDTLYFYASTGDDEDDKHGVYKATLAADGKVTVDLSRSIIGSGLEGPANHDGGGMIIHEGQLYVGVGDTGYNASPPQNHYGTCLNKPNGKILRVNLDGSIPDDNPLASLTAVTGCASQTGAFSMMPPDKRIFAWGLRNPWRIWIDPATDLLWIGDVGEVTQEEITVGGKGVHHGWPFFEGTLEHGELDGVDGCMQVVPARPCTPPAHSYPRGDGVSVTGGLIPPAGCGWGAFEQRYFFADYGSARVWTVDVKPDRSGAVPNSRKQFGSVDTAVSFRMGPDGAMYIASYGGGTIHRLAPKDIPASCNVAAAPSAPRASTSGDGGTGDAADSSDCGCNLAAQRGPRFAALAILALAGLLAVRARSRRIRRL